MESHRKKRLAQLIKTEFDGDRAKFQQATGLSKGRVSQLLDVNEAFGERAARSLIDKLNLSDRWFDLPMPAANIAPAQIGAPEPPSLQSTLALLSVIVATSDDLTRDQLKPLFNRMLDEPQRADEIAERIKNVIAAAAAGKNQKSSDAPQMPDFLKKHGSN